MTWNRDLVRSRLRRGAVVALALVVSYGALTVVLGRFLDPVALADWLQPRLSAVLHRDVSIGSAHVKFLPFGFELDDLEVSDPTGLSPRLASADAVRFRVELLPLLRRHVSVRRITVASPMVDLRVAEDGRSNFSLPADTIQTPAARARPFALDLRRVRVSGGHISYANLADSISLSFEAFEATSSVRRGADGPWVFDGVTAAGFAYSGRGVEALTPLPTEMAFELEAEPDFSAVTIRSGELRMEPVSLALGGRIDRLRGPTRDVELSASIVGLRAGQLFEVAPGSIRAQVGAVDGTLSADLSIVGEVDATTRPTLTGRLALTGGRAESPSGAALVDDLSAEIGIQDDGSLTTTVRGSVLGGPATVEGRISFGTERLATLAMQATPDLALLASLLVLPDGAWLAGELTVDVGLDVPIDNPGAFVGDGDLTVMNGRLRTPLTGPVISLPNVTMKLVGQRLTLEGQTIDLGSERVVVSGVLRDPLAMGDSSRTPYVEGSLQATRLTLHTLSARPVADTSITYSRVATARVTGGSVHGVGVEEAARALGLERPARLPIAGRVDFAIDTLVDRRGSSEDLRASVEFGPTFVRVGEATYRRYGGRVTTGANIALGSDPAQPFTMRVHAEAVDASAFLGTHTPLRRSIRGTFSVDMDLSGTLDDLLLPSRSTLIGGGRFDLTQGGLRATPLTERLAVFLGNDALREPTITNWGAPFVLEDGSVRLAESTLVGTPGAPRVGGTVGLDGALELSAVFDLPRAQLDSSVVRRLGGLAAVVAAVGARPELTRATLNIRGNVVAPEVTAAPGAQAATIIDVVREELTEEIRDRVQERRENLEERATDYLRDLLRRRGGANRIDTVGAAR